MSDDRLFGRTGAECLHNDLHDAITTGEGPLSGDTVTFEEWDCHPPAYHFPAADWAAEMVADWACDNETDEWWAEQATDAIADPEVVAAYQAAIDVHASKISYRMARNKVAIYEVTYADDDYTIGPRTPMCTYQDCRRPAGWRNANGAACDTHTMWLSQINGGNDAIVGIKDRSR